MKLFFKKILERIFFTNISHAIIHKQKHRIIHTIPIIQSNISQPEMVWYRPLKL